MTTTRDTKDWRDRIEVAEKKAEEAADAAHAAFDELLGLGEMIEEEADSLISDLATAERERDEFEKERDAMEDERDEARANLAGES